jgi:2-haloacid dehalogenase
MHSVLVFDVNETLLDMAALDGDFERLFGKPGVRGLWFTQFIHNALVATLTGAYAPFGEIGMAALTMVAARHNVTLTDADKDTIRQGLSHLPAHPEVAESLTRLRAAGYRLASLTNSTLAVAQAQLGNAGLSGYFERMFSADEVKRLKPAPDAYLMVAQALQVPIGEMCMVAAHAWDITGAMRAGTLGAFVARPGMVLDPLAPQPMLIGRDLRDVADQFVARAAQR